MAITTRATKGSALTHNEVDTNFTDLRDGVGGGTVALGDSGRPAGRSVEPDLRGDHHANCRRNAVEGT